MERKVGGSTVSISENDLLTQKATLHLDPRNRYNANRS
jgi:hypothetical protein